MDLSRWGTNPAFSPTQLVAYNFRRARELRGLTQLEAADVLAPILGVLWSQASVSDVEQAGRPNPRRPREFDVEELSAFSRAFDLPIGWFFLPPEEDATDESVIVIGHGHPDNLHNEPLGSFLNHALALSSEVDPEYDRRLGQAATAGPDDARSRVHNHLIDDFLDILDRHTETTKAELESLRGRAGQLRGSGQ